MPSVYDPKHGPEPDAPRVMYCRTHGWFVLPDDFEAEVALLAEHQHLPTEHLAYIGDADKPRCEVCGPLPIPDGMTAKQVVATHNAEHAVA